MKLKALICEDCDMLAFPESIIKWRGECPCCKGKAYVIEFDWLKDDGIKAEIGG